MHKKAIGSVLMILGTSIGAGMLALPVVTAHESFSITLILLIAAWLLMIIGAFSVLEVNLWLNPNTNLISMAEATIGKWGKSITWVFYLLLLYSLISAYLSGMSDILHSLLASIHIMIPRWTSTFLALALFGAIVYRGISSVDLVNRGLMSLKFIAYFIIVIAIVRHIHISTLFQGDLTWRNSAFLVMLTSFGYAIILPSLRTYLDSNKKLLIKVVLFGSLLPFLVYAIWIFAVQGLLPRTGTEGLIAMITSENTNSMLMNSMGQTIGTFWLADIVKIFISICAITSFLGVSICLTDFIADGLQVAKRGRTSWLVYGVSYLPPLILVLFLPGIYIHALDYAGILCLIILVLLPLSMLYFGRYRIAFEGSKILPLGKVAIMILLLLGVVLLFASLF